MRYRGLVRVLPALALCLFVGAGCSGQVNGHAGSWYAAHDGVMPRGESRIYVCHAFGCARKTPVEFTEKDLRTLRAILARGKASAREERKAIARAIAWSEKRIGPEVGSSADVGGYDLYNAGVPGQMDCIDEATNTTSVLLVAARNGYLRHHEVRVPVARGFFLDGRYPHATAVVAERPGGAAYAVDSWPKANGVPPVIMPLEAWFAART